MSGLSFQKPANSTIPDTPAASYTYDALGSRTQMTDGPSSVQYEYNSISQMTAETRQFSDTLANAPLSNNGYKIQYSYHLGGQLKSLTEPFGVTVNYNLDKTGRLTSVAPTSYGGITAFASNAQYRAWGALKHLEYGNGMQMDQTFNNRLQAASYQLGDSQAQVMNKTYDYYADGSLKYIEDQLNYRFHRLNIYDQTGRIKEAKSGTEAQGQTIADGWNQIQNLPYRQSYQYNAFGDITERYSKVWGADTNLTKSYQMTNHRIVYTANPYSGIWEYDADGRTTQGLEASTNTSISYDAAGQLAMKHDIADPQHSEDKLFRYYGGDGRELKRTTDKCVMLQENPPPTECSWGFGDTIYYIRSTVLGGETIAEVNLSGDARTRFVRAGGAIIADLRKNIVWQYGSSSYDAAYYEHTDASGMSFRTTKRQMPSNQGDDSDERHEL